MSTTLKRRRLAVISTNIIVCPPPGYSGLEMLAWQQAQGLARRGHDVILVAPKGSKAPDGVRIWETRLGEPEAASYKEYKGMLTTREAIIDNSWEKYSYLSKMSGELSAPILGVNHAIIIGMYNSAPPVAYPCFVSISKDHAESTKAHLGVATRVVYNGIDLDFYKAVPNAIKTGRYLFLGRMSTAKGPHLAVDVSRRARVPLDLVGDDLITGEPSLIHRLRQQAKTSNGQIAYIGPVDRDKTAEFYSTRKALLHMNKFFREPFGLAPVEAQACGMPVIAFDNGAMRETVRHGETGFLVRSEDEVVELIRQNAAASIRPDQCREWASKFSLSAMIDGYEQLVEEALDTGGW